MALNDGPDRYYYGAGDIFGVLRSLQAERSSVNVQFDNGAQLYNTMILDANLAERYFLMDEVTPRDGHRKIEDGVPFSIRASINGIKVHAKDLVRGRVLRNADGIYYQVPFPAKMLYLQRREAFRAYVPGSMATTVRFSSPERSNSRSATRCSTPSGLLSTSPSTPRRRAPMTIRRCASKVRAHRTRLVTPVSSSRVMKMALPLPGR